MSGLPSAVKRKWVRDLQSTSIFPTRSWNSASLDSTLSRTRLRLARSSVNFGCLTARDSSFATSRILHAKDDLLPRCLGGQRFSPVPGNAAYLDSLGAPIPISQRGSSPVPAEIDWGNTGDREAGILVFADLGPNSEGLAQSSQPLESRNFGCGGWI